MQELGLPYEITADEIVHPHGPDMMLFALYLYLTLPQFVPRTTVEFSVKLGEMLVKELELTNPSKKAISYSARLEGHKDFSVESSLVRIDPKSSSKLTLRCTPTSAVTQEARLVLMSRKDAGAHAATLVFLLQTKVNTRAPLKRVRTEGPLYEMQQFEFMVTNPFPADGDFQISILQEPAEPLPKKEPEPDPKDKRGGKGRGVDLKKAEKASQGGDALAGIACGMLHAACSCRCLLEMCNCIHVVVAWCVRRAYVLLCTCACCSVLLILTLFCLHCSHDLCMRLALPTTAIPDALGMYSIAAAANLHHAA